MASGESKRAREIVERSLLADSQLAEGRHLNPLICFCRAERTACLLVADCTPWCTAVLPPDN